MPSFLFPEIVTRAFIELNVLRFTLCEFLHSLDSRMCFGRFVCVCVCCVLISFSWLLSFSFGRVIPI